MSRAAKQANRVGGPTREEVVRCDSDIGTGSSNNSLFRHPRPLGLVEKQCHTSEDQRYIRDRRSDPAEHTDKRHSEACGRTDYQPVKASQPIAKLDNSDYQATVDQAQAAIRLCEFADFVRRSSSGSVILGFIQRSVR